MFNSIIKDEPEPTNHRKFKKKKTFKADSTKKKVPRKNNSDCLSDQENSRELSLAVTGRMIVSRELKHTKK